MYLPCSLSLLSIPVTVLPRSETAGSQRARLWRGRTGGISGRPRKRGKDAGDPQPSSRNSRRPRAPAPFSDVRRRDSRHASRGAGSGARAWKWAGWDSGGGCEVYAAWHLPPLFTRWGASKQLTFLVPHHSGRPGIARWTPRPDFPCLHREERCCLQVRPRILAELGGAGGFYPPLD